MQVERKPAPQPYRLRGRKRRREAPTCGAEFSYANTNMRKNATVATHISGLISPILPWATLMTT